MQKTNLGIIFKPNSPILKTFSCHFDSLRLMKSCYWFWGVKSFKAAVQKQSIYLDSFSHSTSVHLRPPAPPPSPKLFRTALFSVWHMTNLSFYFPQLCNGQQSVELKLAQDFVEANITFLLNRKIKKKKIGVQVCIPTSIWLHSIKKKSKQTKKPKQTNNNNKTTYFSKLSCSVKFRAWTKNCKKPKTKQKEKKRGEKECLLKLWLRVDNVTHGKNILPTDFLTFYSRVDI